MKKTNTGHAQEQPLNCCVMTMGIKHAEQLVLLFGKTRVIQLMNQLSELAQHLLPKRAQIAQLSDYRLLFLLPSYTRLDALRLVYDLDEGQIHDGHVIDVETKQNGFVFSIDSYGECGGFCRIDSAQINRTVFEDVEEAKKHVR